MVHEELKEHVHKLVSTAERSAIEIHEKIIPTCNVYDLSHLIGDTDSAYGAATVLHKLLPEDKEATSLWNKSYDINSSAYKGRNRFTEHCECKKKL